MEKGRFVEVKDISTIHEFENLLRSHQCELNCIIIYCHLDVDTSRVDDMTKNDYGIVIAGMISLFVLKST